MPTLLTFGDSNTHGTPPITQRGEVRRYGPELRWPKVCVATLGPEWELVEEGLPGRTAQFADPVMGGLMDGQMALPMALKSHGPLDVLAIMLGTNDVKTRFGATPEKVTAGIAGLLDFALGMEMQERHPGMLVLLICPPPVVETGPISGEFFGAAEIARALPPLYAALAEARGAGFLDAGQHIAVSPIDGIHYDPDAHPVLGRAVAEAIRALRG